GAEEKKDQPAKRCVFHERNVRARRAMANDYSAKLPIASVNGRAADAVRRMLDIRMKKILALAAAWLPFLVLWLIFGMQMGATFRQAFPRSLYAIATAAILGLAVTKLCAKTPLQVRPRFYAL